MNVSFLSHKAVVPSRSEGTPQAGSAHSRMAVRKADAQLQIVWGEVYTPDIPDSQGEFMSRDSVRDLAYRFIAQGLVDKIDQSHNQIDDVGVVVESFIARENDPDFIPHSWVLGVHVPDKMNWDKVVKGELNGFSMEAYVSKQARTIVYEFPDEMTGVTTEAAGHYHKFVVKFDDDGNFLGGVALSGGTNGHTHRITKGTATDTTDNHNHRFSFVEGLLTDAAH